MQWQVNTLIVAGAIIVTWLVGQVIGRARGEPDGRPRFARDWPLLVALLAPAAAYGVDLAEARWVFMAAGSVAVWWLAEALGVTAGRADLAGDPVRCAGIAARRLWGNRWLVVTLGALYLLTWLAWDLQRYAYVERNPESPKTTAYELGWSWAETVRNDLSSDVLSARFLSDLAQQFPTGRIDIGFSVVFVAIALVVGFGYLHFSRKIPVRHRERMAWPFRLTVLYALVTVGDHLWWLRPLTAQSSDPIAVRWIIWGTEFLGFIWAAPALAAIWHIAIRVVRGRRWGPRQALLAAGRTWPLFMPFLFILYLPQDLLFIPWRSPFGAGLPEAYRSLLVAVGAVVQLAMMLVPWAIADRRIGFRRALAWAWGLATGRPLQVLAFVLRWALAMSVIALALSILAPLTYQHPISVVNCVGAVLGGALSLLGMMAIGVLYLRLREEPAPAIAKGPLGSAQALGGDAQ